MPERMVETSPLLKRRIESSVNNLAVASTYSYFRPISSERHRGTARRGQEAAHDANPADVGGDVIDPTLATFRFKNAMLEKQIENLTTALETAAKEIGWQRSVVADLQTAITYLLSERKPESAVAA